MLLGFADWASVQLADLETLFSDLSLDLAYSWLTIADIDSKNPSWYGARLNEDEAQYFLHNQFK